MVSGAHLFFALFNNLALFVALIAIYGTLAASQPDLKGGNRQLVLGLAFGLFALGCMHAKIPVAHGVIVDQRNAIVALSGAFGGPVSALVCAAITGSYRAYLGGSGVVSGVSGICLAALSGIVLRRFQTAFDTLHGGAQCSFFATMVILPGFLLVGDLRNGLALMAAMTVPYGTAIFLGILLVGMLLRREDRRHQAEQRFRQMVAMAPEAIVVIDHGKRVQLFNAKAEAYSGCQASEVLGRPLTEQTWLTPESQIALDGHLRSVQDTNDAKAFDVHVRDGELVLEAFVVRIGSTTGQHEWLMSLRDLTARKRAEEARAEFEARILQSKSLEALGRLAGGVAHDFNNMLTVILGTTDLLATQGNLDATTREDLNSINAAAAKAADLTAQLLAFGRKQVLAPQVLNPNDVVKDLLPLLQRSIPENIELNVTCATKVSNVLVDVARFEQVLVNLVVNARDAMPQGGKLTVGTCDRELDAAYAAGHPEVVPGRYVELSVSDTGCGMSEEVRARIFEPFYTTKARGKGTGLGLATVHGIVRQSGGHIYVYSEPGKGACFRVYFPSSEREQVVVSSESQISQTRMSGHVLLAEDSDLVRAPIRRMLISLGFRVTEAAGGKEAVAAYLNSKDPIDLVLTDVVMRDLSGRDLVDEIRKHDASIPVLYMSGYTENTIVHQGVLDADVDFIPKPFTVKSLREALAQALARPSKMPPK